MTSGIELGHLQPLSAGNSAEFSQVDNSKTIQSSAMKLTLLDSLGSWESIYVYFNIVTWKNHEGNHFEGISLFRSITSDHEKARKTRIHSCQQISLD